MVEKMKEGYEVVNTSRFQPGGGQRGVDAYRRLISYCANIFMKIMFNISGVRDFSCGFRAYNAKVIKDAIGIFGNGFIQLKGLGFTSTLETTVKLKLL
jgi:dolichol-phosphate mannosyltransferase